MEKGTLKEGRIEYIHHESKEIRDVESLPPLLSFFFHFFLSPVINCALTEYNGR